MTRVSRLALLGAAGLSLMAMGGCSRPVDDRGPLAIVGSTPLAAALEQSLPLVHVGSVVRVAGEARTLAEVPTLDVSLGSDVDASAVLTLPGSRDTSLTIAPLDLPAMPASIEGLALTRRHRTLGLDVVHMVGRDRFEELRVLRGQSAPTSARYALTVTGRLRSLRLRAGRIEAIDDAGAVAIASEIPYAVDARGQRRELTSELTPSEPGAATLTVRLDTRGLAFPIVIDPAWVAAGTLPTVLGYTTATELSSGEVLVAGGYRSGSTATQSAFLYDPATKTFKSTSNMREARARHSATRLPSGDVILAGGDGATNALASTEIYRAKTGSFELSGSLPEAHVGHFAVAIDGGGSILLGGGADAAGGNPLSTAAIYDPTAGTWSSTAHMSGPRDVAAAAALGGGKVLVAGGAYGSGYLSTSEIYDRSTKGWSTTSTSMHAQRGSAGVAVLPSGGVLVTGGFGSGSDAGFLSDGDIFTLTSGWVATAPMSSTRASHGSYVIDGGGVLVFGGLHPSGALPDCEIYDPLGNTWHAAPPLAAARYSAASAMLSSGRVLTIAGMNADFSYLSTAEELSPLADGAPCTLPGACEHGACVSGRCGSTGDAGADAADGSSDVGATDALPDADAGASSGDVAAADGAPTPGTTPTVSGDFTTCVRAADCKSGFCADGVCCDSPCTGTCMSCALPSSPGKCALQPFGVDYRNECRGRGDCASTCSGSGSCATAGAGTICSLNACTDATHGKGAVACTAEGASCAVASAIVFDCAPYACEKAFGACASSCKTSVDCAPGSTCDSSGRCLPAASSSGGGCTISAPHMGSSWALWLAGMCVVLRRRRRRAEDRACRQQ